MRAFYATILWVALCCPAHATVHTLSNMPGSAGQFSTFAAAHAAALGGDTIYVHGSSVNYGNISITKPLVIIGTGHHPDKQNPLVSSFGNVFVGVSNVQLIGLSMTLVGSSTGITNGVVRKCRIQHMEGFEAMSLFGATNWLIEGNIIISSNTGLGFFGNVAPGAVIRNNVFITFGPCIIGIYNSSGQQTAILNNVFLGSGITSTPALWDIRFCNIDNNIFYEVPPEGFGNTNITCTMNNNISYNSADDTFYQPGLNNLPATNPGFTSYPGFPATYDYNWDLRLVGGSPGKNSGTDGTDRGVFGGVGEIFTTTGEPAIAEITAFTITSPTTIAPGGTLTISVTSKRVH